MLLGAGNYQSAYRCSFHPINIHQHKAKANMFPLCDFAIDETRKTSPSCLSCSAHTDGNGTPKRIMVRKQNNHLQTKMWSDMTAQRWFPGYAPCVHNKPILDNALFFPTPGWSRPPCFLLITTDYVLA